MPSVDLTDALLRSLEGATTEHQIDYADTRSPGLIARHNQAGRISFFVRYTWHGTKRRDAIGTYGRFAGGVSLAKARARAQVIRGYAREGIDPRRPATDTLPFGDLVDRYIDLARTEKRSWREDRRIIDKDLRRPLGKTPTGSITRQDVRQILQRIYDRGAPVQANRTQALLHRIMAFAVEEGVIQASPVAGLRRLHREKPSERVLSDDDLKAIWCALDQDPSGGARALQVLMLVGQRPTEVLHGRTSEIDGHWWTIPGERTKNRKPHMIYLADQALALIDRVDRPREEELMFPGRVAGQPLSWLAKVYRRARKVSGVHFMPKDFRPTFVTGLSRLGFPEPVKQACVNHTPSNVTARHYDKWAYAPEKQEAFSAWSSHVLSVLAGERRSLLPFPRR